MSFIKHALKYWATPESITEDEALMSLGKARVAQASMGYATKSSDMIVPEREHTLNIRVNSAIGGTIIDVGSYNPYIDNGRNSKVYVIHEEDDLGEALSKIIAERLKQ
jgi:hypothetical protein